MSTTPATGEAHRYPPGVRGPLRPFSGVVCPYIGFESGHTIWLIAFDETPTPVGRYSELWLETPDGELTLYTSREAADYVTSYHDFDRVEEAAFSWQSATSNVLDVTMESADGTTLGLRVELENTIQTRVLNTLTRFVPESFAQTSTGTRLSTAVFNLLLDVGGSSVRGYTETGVEYWSDPDQLRAVSSAHAELDGLELGRVVPSRSRHIHGDVKRWTKPYALFGRLHLEYPVPGQPVTR